MLPSSCRIGFEFTSRNALCERELLVLFRLQRALKFVKLDDERLVSSLPPVTHVAHRGEELSVAFADRIQQLASISTPSAHLPSTLSERGIDYLKVVAKRVDVQACVPRERSTHRSQTAHLAQLGALVLDGALWQDVV